jgi:hypothetical protein
MYIGGTFDLIGQFVSYVKKYSKIRMNPKIELTWMPIVFSFFGVSLSTAAGRTAPATASAVPLVNSLRLKSGVGSGSIMAVQCQNPSDSGTLNSSPEDRKEMRNDYLADDGPLATKPVGGD